MSAAAAQPSTRNLFAQQWRVKKRTRPDMVPKHKEGLGSGHMP